MKRCPTCYGVCDKERTASVLDVRYRCRSCGHVWNEFDWNEFELVDNTLQKFPNYRIATDSDRFSNYMTTSASKRLGKYRSEYE